MEIVEQNDTDIKAARQPHYINFEADLGANLAPSWGIQAAMWAHLTPKGAQPTPLQADLGASRRRQADLGCANNLEFIPPRKIRYVI